jgi:hypothetical protein
LDVVTVFVLIEAVSALTLWVDMSQGSPMVMPFAYMTFPFRDGVSSFENATIPFAVKVEVVIDPFGFMICAVDIISWFKVEAVP